MFYLKSMEPQGAVVAVTPIGEKYVFHDNRSVEFQRVAEEGGVSEKQASGIITDDITDSDYISLDKFMDHYIVLGNGDTFQVLAKNQKPVKCGSGIN